MHQCSPSSEELPAAGYDGVHLAARYDHGLPCRMHAQCRPSPERAGFIVISMSIVASVISVFGPRTRNRALEEIAG